MCTELLDILKEMGKVKHNQVIATRCADYHKMQYEFFAKRYLNRELRDEHYQKLIWWTEKRDAINRHLGELHDRLRRERDALCERC